MRKHLFSEFLGFHHATEPYPLKGLVVSRSCPHAKICKISYARSALLEQRRALMDGWSSYAASGRTAKSG